LGTLSARARSRSRQLRHCVPGQGPVINLDVAIKVLHRHVDNVRLRERLVREGRALARIQHQNVVRVLGVEFNGDRAGLCTEFIEGDTLETRSAAMARQSQTQAIEVGKVSAKRSPPCTALGSFTATSRRGNVMRERDTGRIVLMDFGTDARFEDELASRALGMQAPPIYMAANVLANQPARTRSDVYSLVSCSTTSSLAPTLLKELNRGDQDRH
jgi:serine/threonine protein kinase